jgi:hypothetical protein
MRMQYNEYSITAAVIPARRLQSKVFQQTELSAFIASGNSPIATFTTSTMRSDADLLCIHLLNQFQSISTTTCILLLLLSPSVRP